MKSTYKLIGAFWDGMPINDNGGAARPYAPDIESCAVPENLFDYPRFRRALPISKLLGTAQGEDVDAFVHQLDRCDEAFLVLDYQPQTRGSVPNQFYQKRILQILTYMQEQLPHTHVQFMHGATTEGGLFG